MRRLLLIVVLALIGAGGCSYQTAGSPQGGRVLSADFSDVQNLVVGKAGPLLTALSGNDISTIVDAGSTAFGDRGPELQKMIGQTNQLLGLFAAQRAKLDGSVNDLARLGHDLAKGQDELSKLPAS